MKVWDTTSGALVAWLAEHLKAVEAAEFSPDGRQVVTSSFDGTAKVWDLPAAAISAKQ